MTSQQICGLDVVAIILYMRKLKLREFKWSCRGHTGPKDSQDSGLMTLFVNTVRKKIKRERGHRDSHLELLWKGSWQEAPQGTRVERWGYGGPTHLSSLDQGRTQRWPWEIAISSYCTTCMMYWAEGTGQEPGCGPQKLPHLWLTLSATCKGRRRFSYAAWRWKELQRLSSRIPLPHSPGGSDRPRATWWEGQGLAHPRDPARALQRCFSDPEPPRTQLRLPREDQEHLKMRWGWWPLVFLIRGAIWSLFVPKNNSSSQGRCAQGSHRDSPHFEPSKQIPVLLLTHCWEQGVVGGQIGPWLWKAIIWRSQEMLTPCDSQVYSSE